VSLSISSNNRISVWEEVGGVWSNIATFGSRDSGPEQLLNPRGVVADTAGTVYIADERNSRISVWKENDGVSLNAAGNAFITDALSRIGIWC
jgi:hypothetical protein